LKKRWIRQQESRVKISGNFGTKPSIRGAYDRAGLSLAAARSPTARLAEAGTIEGGVFHLDPRMGWVAGVERTEETRFNDLGEERENTTSFYFQRAYYTAQVHPTWMCQAHTVAQSEQLYSTSYLRKNGLCPISRDRTND
jgi:hypothetical protein